MPEVDQVTGLPKEMVRKDYNTAKIEYHEEQRAAADRLNEDLKSEKGQLVLHNIQEQFLSRVNKLIDEDGECRGYKKILASMGLTLNMGEMAVNRLMKLVTKK